LVNVYSGLDGSSEEFGGDGTPKLALDRFARHAPRIGIMQWFHFQEDWLDRKREAIADSGTTVAFCFTPNQEGTAPHHASPPRDPLYFADFFARMIESYAPAQAKAKVA
jgi:hypothetical protein